MNWPAVPASPSPVAARISTATREEQNPPREASGPITRWEVACALLGSALAAAVFLAPALLTGRYLSPADFLLAYYPWHSAAPPGWAGPSNPLLSDSVDQFEPWLRYTAHRLASGGLPLWNPDNLLGAPFIGNMQSAVFFPLNWPALLWPDAAVLALRAWLKLVVAALGTYLLARQVARVGPLAAAVAALTFSFGAFLTVWLLWPQTASAIWLPWLWWATARLVARPGPRPAAGLAVCAALPLLAGHAETAYHLAEGTGLFLLFRLVQAGPRGWRPVARVLGWWAGAYALGAAVAAVQLAPFLEYSNVSMALLRRTERQGTPFWVPVHYAWSAISPDLFGNPARGSWWGIPINYNEYNNYCGVLPLVLAPLAFLARDRAARGLAFFLAGLLTLALGVVYHAPLIFDAAMALPGMRLVLNNRLVLVAELALALLAALGVEAVVQATAADRRRLGGALALGTLGWLALGVGVPALLGHQWFDLPRDSPAALLVWQTALGRAIGLLLGTAALVGASLAAGRRRPALRAALLALLPLVLGADLWEAHRDYNPTVAPRDYYPPTAATTYLAARPGLFRTVAFGWLFMPNTNLDYGLADLRGYDAVEAQSYYRLAYAPALKPDPAGDYHLSPILNLLNVRYLLVAPGDDPNRHAAAPPAGGAGPWFVRVQDGGATAASIYENRRALPRAWLAHRASAADPAGQPARLADPSFDAAGTALLAAPLPAVEPLPSAPPAPGADSVTVVDYAPETVDLATRSPAAAILILSDQAFPGWEATVDGRPAPILTADVALRGVYLPAGAHRLRFAYRPASFAAGAAISTAGLLVLVVLVAWPGYGIIRQFAAGTRGPWPRLRP